MPETNRMAGPIRFVEHELTTFEGNRLGLIEDFDKKAGHHSGCWLWGGRTVSKLAAVAAEGKVYGVDYSTASVAVAKKINTQWIAMGRVEILEGSVSQLPCGDEMFDLVTAVETHVWWPDLPADMREVLRVLRPGGTLLIIAEIYKGAKTETAKLAEKYLPLSGMKLLNVDEHRDLFTNTGYSDVQVIEELGKGWICGTGRKPAQGDSIERNGAGQSRQPSKSGDYTHGLI
jgi:SAM-dependent methyltransferase